MKRTGADGCHRSHPLKWAGRRAHAPNSRRAGTLRPSGPLVDHGIPSWRRSETASISSALSMGCQLTTRRDCSGKQFDAEPPPAVLACRARRRRPARIRAWQRICISADRHRTRRPPNASRADEAEAGYSTRPFDALDPFPSASKRKEDVTRRSPGSASTEGPPRVRHGFSVVEPHLARTNDHLADRRCLTTSSRRAPRLLFQQRVNTPSAVEPDIDARPFQRFDDPRTSSAPWSWHDDRGLRTATARLVRLHRSATAPVPCCRFV